MKKELLKIVTLLRHRLGSNIILINFLKIKLKKELLFLVTLLRHRPDSNRGRRFCRPVPSRSATTPDRRQIYKTIDNYQLIIDNF